jgi:hypothetical protein
MITVEAGGAVPAELEQAARELRQAGDSALVKALEISVRAELLAQRPAAEQAAAAAQAAARDARDALSTAEILLDAIRAELAECQRRSAVAAAATADDDMTNRIAARSMVAAMAEECESLHHKAAQREQEHVVPLAMAAEQALRNAEKTAAELTRLDHAIAHPLSTMEGRRTQAWLSDFFLSGRWSLVFAAGAPDDRSDDNVYYHDWLIASGMFDELTVSTGRYEKIFGEGRQQGHNDPPSFRTFANNLSPFAAQDNSQSYRGIR